MKSGVGQRLVLVVLLLVGVGLTAGLLLYALRGNIDLFYTPSQVVFGRQGVIPEVGQRLQLGGMVLPGSVERNPDSLAVEFVVYDKDAQIHVSYEGILPDLFEEGQSVVAKGVLGENYRFEADTILAKHDENYTPPEVTEAMQENHSGPASSYQSNVQPNTQSNTQSNVQPNTTQQGGAL